MSNKKIFPIGISGVATAGKDTLCRILIDLLEERGMPAQRFALADALKAYVNAFLVNKFGISAFTTNPHEKQLIRPMVVTYGKMKREQSRGTYWTTILQKDVEQSLQDGVIPIVTDIRYDEYPEDEVTWLRNTMNGKLVHLVRVLSIKPLENGNLDCSCIGAANQEEAINDPKVIKKSDFHLMWKTIGFDLSNDKENKIGELNNYGMMVLKAFDLV